MPKESDASPADLAAKLRAIRDLLDDAIVLVDGVQPKKKDKPPRPPANDTRSESLDYSMSDRAFIKANGRGLSGPRKLTLLVAYLAKGDESARVSVTDIVSSWNRLTGVLGMKFNPAHASRARENDWVDTEKAGLYYLRPNWKKALE